MEPILRKKKDIVVIENAKIADIKLGDIIAFYNKNEEMIEEKTNIICHRVIKIKGNQLIEKGDLYLSSSIVNDKNYIGRVRYILRNNKKQDMTWLKWKMFNRLIAYCSRVSLWIISIKKKAKFYKMQTLDLHHKGCLYYFENALLKLMRV